MGGNTRVLRKHRLCMALGLCLSWIAAPALAGAMWGMFARMPWSGRRALVAATLGVA